jgi:hypothetical protein
MLSCEDSFDSNSAFLPAHYASTLLKFVSASLIPSLRILVMLYGGLQVIRELQGLILIVVDLANIG